MDGHIAFAVEQHRFDRERLKSSALHKDASSKIVKLNKLFKYWPFSSSWKSYALPDY